MAKLHLIGNAHLDPVWLWTWQDGFAEIMATYRSALDRMNDFPDYKFTSACAAYYQWIEKIDPKMFEEIQQRVKEGRWNIVGGWFIQPDCNIPCGEIFARHGLISQRYFSEKFGVTAKTGYNVDSFGHNAALPKILSKSGMKNYVFMRPDINETYLKDTVFKWQSDNGDTVTAFRIPNVGYYNIQNVDSIKKIKELAEKEDTDYMVFYGVGNHGGGPTIKLINQIKELDIEDMSFSDCDEYFNSTDTSRLKIVNDELQHHARGCYSASSFVKAQNRKCEQNLLAAEKLCVMAKKLVGYKYPDKKLQKAWKNLLFNQFHDILGGCSIKSAYGDAGYLFGETMSITEQIMVEAMQKIAWNIDTLGSEVLPGYKVHEGWTVWEHEVLGTPVVIFNPHSWRVKMPVKLYAKANKITNHKGEEIPIQIIRGEQTNGEDKFNISFNAEVEPYGYAVYRIFREKPSECEFEKQLKITSHSLENNKLSVKFDLTSGDIKEIFDKENNKYIINKPCRAVVLDETECDTWAHNKTQLGEIVGMFDTPEFKVIEDGCVKATLRVTTRYASSSLIREYSLTPDSSVINVNAKIDFHEKHKVLKFCFPLCDDNIISQIPYGTIKRAAYTGEEPNGMWIANGSLCIANKASYAHDSQNGELRMTVLRSPIYADHYAQEHRDDFCEYMEQGITDFSYSIFPYEDNVTSERIAMELNFGLKPFMGSFHSGKLPEAVSCYKSDNDNILVSCIKESYDNKSDIIRFYDMSGENSDVNMTWFDKNINTTLIHNDIKTFNSLGEELDLTEAIINK